MTMRFSFSGYVGTVLAMTGNDGHSSKVVQYPTHSLERIWFPMRHFCSFHARLLALTSLIGGSLLSSAAHAQLIGPTLLSSYNNASDGATNVLVTYTSYAFPLAGSVDYFQSNVQAGSNN